MLGNGVGPGMPRKFLHDNGGEFCNPEFIDLAEKHSISLAAVTAANSPYSNGICERNHAVVDLMMQKIKAGDESMTDQEALNYALHAKNMETSTKGFSPYQIVYGANPNIPGVSNSTVPSLNENFKSIDVKKHITRIHLARQAFCSADNDSRIKRALKSRVSESNDEMYEAGDMVIFKEDDKL